LEIAPSETGGSLHDRLAELAPAVLAETLTALADGSAPRTPQDDAASSYIAKLAREHGLLDWSQPAEALERRIRAYDPWPGTFALAQEGAHTRRLKIFPPTTVVAADLRPGEISTTDGRLLVGCGNDALALAFVQPEGGRKMTAAAYLRGRPPEAFLAANH
jgi:methionyl-tRNA formyltransferase